MSQRFAGFRLTLSHVIFVVPVLWLMSVGAATAAEIGIVGAAAGAGGAHTLTLVVEDPAFDWPITIRRNDTGEPAVAVRIDVTPLIGPSARLADQQRLLANGQPVDPAVLELSSLGQAVVRLVGTLPVEGDFKGQLGVIVAGQRAPYDITITRRKPANPPKVGFVGVTSDGRLAMTSDRSAFEWPIILRRDDTLSGHIEVKLRVSPLAGLSGTLIEPKLLKDGKPLTEALKLPPLGQESLKLIGKADIDGAYTGEITHEIGGVRTPVTLALTRTRPDFDLKVDAISKNRSIAGADGVSLQVRLQNTTSAEREIHLPMIARLDRVNASGSTPVEIGAAGYRLSSVLPGGMAAAQPLRIAGDAGLDLQVTIHGLNDPGSYKGVMRFTAADRKPVDTPFELALRLCWLWAAGAIALGVIVAAWLRYFQQTARPRLLLQRDAVGLRSKLATLVQAEGGDLVLRERQAIAFLIQQLDDASDGLATPDAAIEASATIISTVRRKLPLLSPWITFRRRHDALRPPSVAAVIEPDLDTVFGTLTNPQATDAQITAAQTVLDGLDARIKQALQNHIVASIAEIRTAIGEFPAAEQIEFDQVSNDLNTATAEANVLHLEGAKDALARARSRFAEIAARLLRQKLTAATPAVGFSPAEWTTFIAEIADLLDGVVVEPDPERRVQRWTEANRRYLIEVVRRAKSRVAFLLHANVAGAQAALSTAATELAKAQAELAAGHLAAARTAYEAAMVAADQARPALQAAGNRLGAAPAADASAPNAGADLPPSILETAVGGLLPLALGHDVTLTDVKRALWIYSIGFAVVILALAVLTGLQLLYAPNPAFGWGDLPVAFLWGAGLHAVVGQSFQGLQGVAQQFR